MSDSDLVKQFTEESNGIPCPSMPVPMNYNEVLWITRMIISELDELIKTVAEDSDAVLQTAIQTRDRAREVISNNNIELMSNQYDALVDIYYYMLNQACKKGVNLSKIFKVVHEANMNKRHADGKFHKREDGKIMKPEGWQEPNIQAEILRQAMAGYNVKVGSIYRHYKGNNYKVIMLGYNSQNTEQTVIYQALYNDPVFGDNIIWTRSLTEFTETVTIDNKIINRFTLVE